MQFNAFSRPVEGIQSKSASGGMITILAYATAIILFLSQLYLYIQVDVRHSLDLAPSFPLSQVIATEGGFSYRILQARQGGGKKKKQSKDVYEALQFLERNKIDVFIHVTFPNVKCHDLDFAHNGAYFSTGDFSKYHGYSKLSKRHPTEYDWAVAINGGDMTKVKKGLSKKMSSREKNAVNGCTVKGTMSVPRISGDISISMHKDTFINVVGWMKMGMNTDQIDEHTHRGHDLSHFIHNISFGTSFPLNQNPLSNRMVKFTDQYKIALNYMNVKLVPTKYKRFARSVKETFQISTSNHIVTLETLSMSNPFTLPGLKLQYDFTPLAVHHVESRDNIFVFLSSLIGIVGGTFVTVGLVSGFVVDSAKVLKKMD